MDMNAAFPSENLKAADLQGQEATLTIERVTIETIGDDRRPVVHFQGMPQRLVLNKTNSNTICEIHGAESDYWTGRQITLYSTFTDYQGKQVACIRVKPVGVPATAQAPAFQGVQQPNFGAPPPVPQPGLVQNPPQFAGTPQHQDPTPPLPEAAPFDPFDP